MVQRSWRGSATLIEEAKAVIMGSNSLRRVLLVDISKPRKDRAQVAGPFVRSTKDPSMKRGLIDQVALALFASDGMKIASAAVSLEQSWAMTPERHTEYRERAIVFIKVMGQQMLHLADVEIAKLDETRRR